ncbi:store-operated calcium entry associated regulatory factor [Phyllostomus discolor]|uniref:Store-operated calcium entry-associated regulatory factor n=2 Tax=Phyllostomus discolor TaxID=89673 RepID=A0A6J2MS48_9CHIR|nr:store-operated calcium entry-associated regulatory factor [Phyllostomus discolor]KAF6084850.1 store-operated calcium entry associated regulatory factor [Phyllostomus discolor]
MAAAGGPDADRRCPFLGLLLLLIVGPAEGWKDPDRILLRDVKALTLHHDRYTTSRRLDPIPQLRCVGGTAGCASYTPKVVQCQNKGWDGYDVQWECKTDLDMAYKFGKTEVSCEGYESSEDQYVLRGSCGLEYSLDYTEHGLKKLRESGTNHGPNAFSDYYKKLSTPGSGGMSGLITIVVLLAVAFGVYKLFLSDGQDSPPPYSEYPPNSHHYQGFTSTAGPPPPGFKAGFTGPYGATSGFGSAFTGQQGHDGSGPGFWTGLGTGGLLGYLFGSNRAARPFSDSWYHSSHHPSYSSTWGSHAYSPFGGGSGSSSACSSSETKTRTASGYGGTRRR